MTHRNACLVPLLRQGGCATWSQIRVLEGVDVPIAGVRTVRHAGVDVGG